MDSLCAFLKSETVSHLRDQARISRPARVYFVLLRLSAFLLSYAQGIEEASPEHIDQAVATTAKSIGAIFPDGVNGAHTLLLEFAGDRAISSLQRCERITQAGKTALLLRLSEKRER